MLQRGSLPINFASIDNENVENWTLFLYNACNCIQVDIHSMFVSTIYKDLDKTLYWSFYWVPNAMPSAWGISRQNWKQNAKTTSSWISFGELIEYAEELTHIYNDKEVNRKYTIIYIHGEHFGFLTSNISKSRNLALLDVLKKSTL